MSMSPQQRGIILRSQHPYHRITIFDEKIGKFSPIVSKFPGQRSVPQAILISYSIDPWHDIGCIRNIDLMSYPIMSIEHSIDFIHQLLGIANAFIPAAMPLPDIFNMMLVMYEDKYSNLFSNKFRQKLLLCRVLARLGVYPHENFYRQEAGIRNLILAPIDSMIDEPSEKKMYNIVHLWLMYSIETHPHAKLLLTYKN